MPPFNFHWYVAVPPLVGVAVKVTDVPAQIVLLPGVILTDGVSVEVTVIVDVDEETGVGLIQVPLPVI